MKTLLTSLLLIAALSLGQLALAAEKQYLLTEKTYKVVISAQELMTAEQYSTAESQLLAILTRTKSGSYDRAVVQQTLGYVYSAKSQYKNAREQFQQALNSNALPENINHGLRYNLGQLLLAEDKFKAGIDVLEKWFKAEPNPPNDAHVLIASAYYQTNRFNQSVAHMKQAVSNSTRPPENWYQLLLAGHIALKQYSAGIKVLEKLIVRSPNNDNYWAQLSSLYSGQSKHVSALSVDLLATHLNVNNKRVIERLSTMYRYLQIPYKSALLLQKAMKQGTITRSSKNLNKLADSWLAARERAQAVGVLKQLAKNDASGESMLKLGRVLFEMERWQEASNAFNNSLTRLKGKNRGTASLFTGLAQFYMGNFEQAQNGLNRAARYKNQRRQAQYWLNYIDKVAEAEAEKNEEVLGEPAVKLSQLISRG